MLAQFNIASTATLRFKRKKALVLTDTLTTVHYRGCLMLATMAAVVLVLYGLASAQRQVLWSEEFPHLYTMYLATAIAFAFATSLDILAYLNAGSEDKKVLSALLAYVDGIACLTYLLHATVPSLHLDDAKTGNPVWLLRYAEWAVTCPQLLYWVGLVCRGNPQKVKELMVVDILLLVFGTLATQSRGLLSWVLFGLASACLLQTFRSLWTMTRRAIQLDRRGVVPLNARAINLVCWEIVLSWSLFPVAEGLKQAGILSFEASEACLCVADYASKVGLALIMVSVNFEQLQKLRVTRLQASITSMSNVVEKQQHYHQDLLDRTHGAVQAFLTTTFGIPPTIKEDIEEKENGAFLRFASLQKFESNSALSGYDFDAADLTEAELKLVVLQILNAFDVEETLAVTPAKLEAFVVDVLEKHAKLPYHNAHRAVNVLQATACLAVQMHPEAVPALEHAALLLTAFVHAVDHSGIPNAKLVAMQAPLAQQEMLETVNEQHCARVGVQLMYQHGLFDHLHCQHGAFRTTLRACFEGFQSSGYSSYLTRLIAVADNGGYGCSQLTKDTLSCNFYLAVLAQSASLHSCYKSPKVFQQWQQRLYTELEASGLVKETDMDVAFLTFIAKPWQVQLARCFPLLEELSWRVDVNASSKQPTK